MPFDEPQICSEIASAYPKQDRHYHVRLYLSNVKPVPHQWYKQARIYCQSIDKYLANWLLGLDFQEIDKLYRRLMIRIEKFVYDLCERDIRLSCFERRSSKL